MQANNADLYLSLVMLIKEKLSRESAKLLPYAVRKCQISSPWQLCSKPQAMLNTVWSFTACRVIDRRGCPVTCSRGWRKRIKICRTRPPWLPNETRPGTTKIPFAESTEKGIRQWRNKTEINDHTETPVLINNKEPLWDVILEHLKKKRQPASNENQHHCRKDEGSS